MGFFAALAGAIRRLQATSPGPVVVALDGPSGAGKTTLAATLARELDAAVIPLDEFFSGHIADREWDRFSVEDRRTNVLDWERIRRDAVLPLLAGRPASWRSLDYALGPRPDGTYALEESFRQREPAGVILLDGAYSAAPELAGLVDLAVLVETRAEVRRARLARREERGFLERWHERWDAVEAYYFARERPKASFDFVVPG